MMRGKGAVSRDATWGASMLSRWRFGDITFRHQKEISAILAMPSHSSIKKCALLGMLILCAAKWRVRGCGLFPAASNNISACHLRLRFAHWRWRTAISRYPLMRRTRTEIVRQQVMSQKCRNNTQSLPINATRHYRRKQFCIFKFQIILFAYIIWEDKVRAYDGSGWDFARRRFIHLMLGCDIIYIGG